MIYLINFIRIKSRGNERVSCKGYDKRLRVGSMGGELRVDRKIFLFWYFIIFGYIFMNKFIFLLFKDCL